MIVSIITACFLMVSSVFVLGTVLPKNEILNTYDAIIEDLGENGLSKKQDLEGTREFGIDKYVRNI